VESWHRFYDPVTGRYVSADPIGLAGGMNLYAYVQNDPVNWVDPWGLVTLNEARTNLIQQKVEPTGQVFMGIQSYSDTQIFNEWLKMEKKLGAWWESTTKCPEKICVNEDGKATNPNSEIWSDPNVGLISGIILNHFHEGAVYEIRSMKNEAGSPHGNQCTYDSKGNLIKDIPAAGSADLYGPNNDFSKHQHHDVGTYNLAHKLGRVKDYYSVRPIW